MANKMTVDFKGVDKYLNQLKQFEGAAQKAVDSALTATQEMIADKAAAAMAPHNQTHVTADQIIRDEPPAWTGDMAKISVGFKISDENGELPGLPSIFLMYGTESGNQESIAADKSLYDAVYGKETIQEAHRIQQEAFEKVLSEVMG